MHIHSCICELMCTCNHVCMYIMHLKIYWHISPLLAFQNVSYVISFLFFSVSFSHPLFLFSSFSRSIFSSLPNLLFSSLSVSPTPPAGPQKIY